MSYLPTDFPEELRTYKCDGSHGLKHGRELSFIDGDDTLVELSLEYCADETCAQIVATVCQHASNSWHYTPDYKASEEDLGEEGRSALLCDFCGKDGT